jgi:hypothetical protein
MPTPDQESPPVVECPSCAAPMRLVRIFPKVNRYPDLHTFLCDACRHAETRELK